MSEIQARHLARAISEYPGWTARAERRTDQPWYKHDWWVVTTHPSMEGRGTVPVDSWESFEIAHLAWVGSFPV